MLGYAELRAVMTRTRNCDGDDDKQVDIQELQAMSEGKSGAQRWTSDVPESHPEMMQTSTTA